MISKKIVITGASGFLGRNLIQRLKNNAGYKVIALTSCPDNKNNTPNVTYLHKDSIINDGSILEGAIVINCAFPRNYSGKDMADGLKYIQRVFEIAVNSTANAIINISSQSVYSQFRNEIASENTEICLESPYAVGKYATELMVESLCKEHATCYTNLRMSSLIGPGFDQRVVNRLVKKALAGDVLNVVDSNKRFGFLDVDDAVTAIMQLIKTDTINWKSLYTIGNEKEYSIVEIVNCIKQVFDEANLSFPKMQIERKNEESSTGVSYQQIKEDVGFEPVHSMNESIFRILLDLQDKQFGRSEETHV